jgi:hypothetical protein
MIYYNITSPAIMIIPIIIIIYFDARVQNISVFERISI